MLLYLSIGSSSSVVPFFMHSATSSPVALYASRKGSPFETRKSAQSVAFMKPPAAAFLMFSGIIFIVAIIGVRAVRHILTVSMLSKIASLSSCISLLYASGRPFIVVSSPQRSPITRPALPRASSARSGFFFCGIMLEPVEKASSSSANLNSHEHHMIISSHRREM